MPRNSVTIHKVPVMYYKIQPHGNTTAKFRELCNNKGLCWKNVGQRNPPKYVDKLKQFMMKSGKKFLEK